MSTKVSRREVLAAFAGIAVAGCSSLVSRPAPVKGMFLLDPPAVAAAPGSAARNAVLRVGTFNVAAPFRGKNFVFRRSELGYESDYYDEFFVPPATMLADATARSLSAARVFTRVVASGTAGNEGDYLLDAFVSELYGDTRSAPPAAVIRITFYLSSMAALGSAPVWTHEYAQRVEMENGTAGALASSWNRALGLVLRDLANDLRTVELPSRAG